MENDCHVKVVLESKLSNLPLTRQILRGICSVVVQNEQIFQDIELSLNEALSNVISHGFKNEPYHEVQIIATLSTEQIIFEIIDYSSNNLFDHSLPTKKLEDIDPLSESGRGILLINKLMDEVNFQRGKDKGVLLLRKILTKI